MGFIGFPEEFIDFLYSLQLSNTMEQLPDNKPRYKKLITEPLTRLFDELVPTVRSVSDTLETRPSRCVSSMYNDMRFSKGTPLKGYMYIRFREQRREKDVLGLYFDMGTEYYSYGIRLYNQTGMGMERLRENILKKSMPFTQAMERINRFGLVATGDKYAKDRYPSHDNPTLKELLNRKSLCIGRSRDISDTVFQGVLYNEIADAFSTLKDIFTLLREA